MTPYCAVMRPRSSWPTVSKLSMTTTVGSIPSRWATSSRLASGASVRTSGPPSCRAASSGASPSRTGADRRPWSTRSGGRSRGPEWPQRRGPSFPHPPAQRVRSGPARQLRVRRLGVGGDRRRRGHAGERTQPVTWEEEHGEAERVQVEEGRRAPHSSSRCRSPRYEHHRECPCPRQRVGVENPDSSTDSSLYHAPMLFLISLCVRALARLLVAHGRDDDWKDLEILVLRHQLRVLKRKHPHPKLRPLDRALLAGASRALPRVILVRVSVPDAGPILDARFRSLGEA